MKTNKLDRIDINILQHLQFDARLSNQKLAESVNLSPSACLSRLRKLEREGFIKRYVTDIDIAAISSVVIVFVEVILANHSNDQIQQFEDKVNATSQIVESYQVSGTFDYLLKVVCRDMEEYTRLADELCALPDASIRINSNVLMKQSKPFSGYPLKNID